MANIIEDNETPEKRQSRLANEMKAIPRLKYFYKRTNKDLVNWLAETHEEHYKSYAYDSKDTMSVADVFFEKSEKYTKIFRTYFNEFKKEPVLMPKLMMDLLRESYHAAPTLSGWMYGTGQSPDFKKWYKVPDWNPRDEWNAFMQMYYYLDQTMNDYWADHPEAAFTAWKKREEWSEDRMLWHEKKRFVVKRYHDEYNKKYILLRYYEDSTPGFGLTGAHGVVNHRTWKPPTPETKSVWKSLVGETQYPKQSWRDLFSIRDGRNEIIQGYEIDGKKDYIYDDSLQAKENTRFRTEKNAAEALQKMRIFYTKTVLETGQRTLTKKFSDWFAKVEGPSEHDRNNPKIVLDKANWFLKESKRREGIFREYFKQPGKKPTSSKAVHQISTYLAYMKTWRLSHNNIPTLFSWMHIYGQNPKFKQWLLANYKMESFCTEDGSPSHLYAPSNSAWIQKWMKPYTEADFQQTYYFLDQLMLDYNSGTLDPTQDTWQEEGDTFSEKNKEEGLTRWMAVDHFESRGSRRWELRKSYDLTETYKRLHPDWENTLDVHIYNPRALASQTHRPLGAWIIGRKRWNPPKVSRESQQLIGYKDDGTPKEEPEPPKKQGWFWGESGGAPDACTGNQYHVPLD